MGINVKHLLDRPCSVCEFHKENGCCKWACVFEGEPTTTKNVIEGVINEYTSDGLKFINLEHGEKKIYFQ